MSTLPDPHMGVLFDRLLEESEAARGDLITRMFWAWRDAKRSQEAMYHLYYKRFLRWFGPADVFNPMRPEAASPTTAATVEVFEFQMTTGLVHVDGEPEARAAQRVSCRGFTVEELVDGARSKCLDNLIAIARTQLQTRKPQPANDA